MPRLEPVRAIRQTYDSGCGEDDGPQFIRCVDEQHPKAHEFWNFGEDSVTLEVHPTARVDIGSFVRELL